MTFRRVVHRRVSTDPKHERWGVYVCGRKIAGLTQSCKKQAYYRSRDADDCVASAIIDADADD